MLGHRAVMNLDHLVISQKQYVVVADHRPAANGMDSNFFDVAFYAHIGRPSIYVLFTAGKSFVDFVCNRKGGAAGSVHLLIMVFLNNLNIKFVAKEFRRLFTKLHLQVYAKGHIRGKENRNMRGGIRYHCFILIRISGRGKHGWNIFFAGKSKDIGERFRTGKIDDHIHRFDHPGKSPVNGEGILPCIRHFIDSRHNYHIFILSNAPGKDLAHFSVDAADQYFYHFFAFLSQSVQSCAFA